MTCSVCQQPLDPQGRCAHHGVQGYSLEDGMEETVSTSRRDSMLGRQIGEYVVRRRIGAGGMGIVYEAWQPTIERRAAIKILRSEPGDSTSAAGLIAEARAANAIGHRSIIDIFGFGKLDDLGPYIVMEYLEGSPLDEVVRQRA
ncbi:MAG: protein kinase domain-containing protein, partial [Myxococcales bacterium]